MNITISQEEKKKNHIEYIYHSNHWISESALSFDEKNHLLDVMYELSVIWNRHYLEIENLFDNIRNIKKYQILQQIFLHYYLINKIENRFSIPDIKKKGCICDHFQINRYLDFIKPQLSFFTPNIATSVYFISVSQKDALNYTREQLKNLPKPECYDWLGNISEYCETSFTDLRSIHEVNFRGDSTQYNPLCIEAVLANPVCVMQVFEPNFHPAIPFKIDMFPYKKFCEKCSCNNENNCLYSQTNYKLFRRAEKGRPDDFKESLKNCIIMLEKEIEKTN